MECEPLGQFFQSVFLSHFDPSCIDCYSVLLISLLSNSFLTAALHALILFGFYLLISGLAPPVLVVFHQQNIFSIQKQAAGTLHQQQAAREAQQELKDSKKLSQDETDSLFV